MCDDASPCDLSALPRTDKMDDFDRWSVELAETKNSHYRYQIVCSKWGAGRVLGQGYRYGEARALSNLLMEACAQARPSEDTWTRPIFRPELMRPLIRSRQNVGDLAFVPHEANHAYRDDGSLASYTLRDILVTIEAVSGAGTIQRVRTHSGLVLDDPKVKQSFACDDIHMDRFTEHVMHELAGCSTVETYDYLTSFNRLTEAIYRFARNGIERTPFNTALAATCMREVGLPKGHDRPNISTKLLEQQVSTILTPGYGYSHIPAAGLTPSAFLPQPHRAASPKGRHTPSLV